MLTQSELRALLDYNPDTGAFTWRNGRSNMATGAVAGTNHNQGYVQVSVGDKLYLAHRLAFLWMTGEWPAYQVDHINGDRADNRWINLRNATNQENAHNHGELPRHNTSGFLGVSYYKRDGSWQGRIQVDGRKRHLGYFATPELAHAAYLKAKHELHPTHQRLRQAPVLGATIDKLVRDIDNIPTGRQQSAAWRRAWYFGQAAKDAHQAGDYITARHLLRDAKQSFKEI